MKTLILIALYLFALSANATPFICTSKDYNPVKFNGQSLIVFFDGKNVSKIEKIKGSWFCDSGIVNNPRILAEHSKATIYEANFQCDESNARLIVPRNFMSHYKMIYTFTGGEIERASYTLHCSEIGD